MQPQRSLSSRERFFGPCASEIILDLQEQIFYSLLPTRAPQLLQLASFLQSFSQDEEELDGVVSSIGPVSSLQCCCPRQTYLHKPPYTSAPFSPHVVARSLASVRIMRDMGETGRHSCASGILEA